MKVISEKIVIALIGASVILMLALTIAEYGDTGEFDIIQVAIAITMVLLTGVPYRSRPAAPRPKVGRKKT